MGSGASKKPPPPDLDAEAKEFEAKMEALSEEEKKAAQKQRNSELRKRFVANLERGTLARDAARARAQLAALHKHVVVDFLHRHHADAFPLNVFSLEATASKSTVESAVRKLHVSLAHPAPADMVRMLRHGGATPAALEAAYAWASGSKRSEGDAA